MTISPSGADKRLRPWLLVAVFSLVGFVINASTFYALGVVLPDMVRDERWSFGAAGLGFTILGGAVGSSSFLPALLIRRFGVRFTVLCGTGAMMAGFACISVAHSLMVYFVGAALCGVGYQMMAFIPGTHVIAATFEKRAAPLGVYFTVTALGGVAGPAIALAVMANSHHDWRLLWKIQAAAIFAVGVLCAVSLGGRQWFVDAAARTDLVVADDPSNPIPARIWRTPNAWTVREALRTSQFYVLLAAYFAHLLVGVSVSSWSVAHLTERGVTTGAAVVMLSLEALVQTGVRALGGLVGDRIDPRHLLVAALGAVGLGSGALSVAHNTPEMLLYAVGCGAGFGLTALAVTLLLLNYFGRAKNLELFSLVCLVGAVSALGSAVAGKLRDMTGSFSLTFQIYAVVAGVVAIATIFMRPPRRSADVN